MISTNFLMFQCKMDSSQMGVEALYSAMPPNFRRYMPPNFLQAILQEHSCIHPVSHSLCLQPLRAFRRLLWAHLHKSLGLLQVCRRLVKTFIKEYPQLHLTSLLQDLDHIKAPLLHLCKLVSKVTNHWQLPSRPSRKLHHRQRWVKAYNVIKNRIDRIQIIISILAGTTACNSVYPLHPADSSECTATSLSDSSPST